MHARLVVTDAASAVRTLLGPALAASTVLPAARGDDTRALLHRARPGLAVPDVRLPGLDDLAVARALAATPG
jgi:DNA-binding response OmpR family regulator